MQIVIQRFTPLPPPPSSPCFRLFIVGHSRFYTLIFCKLYLIALLSPEKCRKTFYTHQLTRAQTDRQTHLDTHTHTTCHVTIWLPDLPVGPEQHSSAKGVPWQCRTDGHKERGVWREGWNLSLRNSCFLSSYICRLRQRRERGRPFCDPTQGKSQREDAWCNTTKWPTSPLLVCHLGIGVVLMFPATPGALCGRWQSVHSVLAGLDINSQRLTVY